MTNGTPDHGQPQDNTHIDRNPGVDLHGGLRPCLTYAWCDKVHRAGDTRHDTAGDAAGLVRLAGDGLSLPVRLVDADDNGRLAIHLELEDDEGRALVVLPLDVDGARVLRGALDQLLDYAQLSASAEAYR